MQLVLAFHNSWCSLCSFRSGEGTLTVRRPLFPLTYTNKSAGAPATVDAPAEAYLVLPICIRTDYLIEGVEVGVPCKLCLGSTLDGIDRRRQCGQFWSFVIHGLLPLFSLLKFTYIS